MPPSPTPAAAPAPEFPAPSYPTIESFIEHATPEEVAGLFTSVKQGLEGLKGPKVEQGKKVQAAIARTEELLGILLETRERLIAEAKGPKARR